MSSQLSFFTQAETICVILAGIAGLVIDSSFITFSRDMGRVWKIALDPYKFPPMKQMNLKYFLSVLLILRTFTVHLTIALYVVMLWPAIFVERSYLLIPWLVIGSIRLAVDFLATFAGLYICSKYGLFHTLWIEFLIVQILQHGPFHYIWMTIMKFRLYLLGIETEREKSREIYEIKQGKQSRIKLMALRKRTLDEIRNSGSYTTLTTIIQRINDREKENISTRSLDTLLEIIDRNNQHEDVLSVNSEMSSGKTDSTVPIEIMSESPLCEKEEAVMNTFNGLLDYKTDDSTSMKSPNELDINVDMENQRQT